MHFPVAELHCPRPLQGSDLAPPVGHARTYASHALPVRDATQTHFRERPSQTPRPLHTRLVVRETAQIGIVQLAPSNPGRHISGVGAGVGGAGVGFAVGASVGAVVGANVGTGVGLPVTAWAQITSSCTLAPPATAAAAAVWLAAVSLEPNGLK